MDVERALEKSIAFQLDSKEHCSEYFLGEIPCERRSNDARSLCLSD